MVYRARVEKDDLDPKMGKVKVRILGIHDENVKVEHLPNAEVVQSTAFRGGLDGKGSTAIPQKGSWVYVVFENEDYRKPIILGIIKSADKNNPNGDISRLGNGKELDKTGVKTRKSKQDKGISSVKPKTKDEDQEENSKVKYPNNTVFECPSGSFFEFDNSNGSRIQMFHKSGSFFEFKNNGNVLFKTIGENKEIVYRDKVNLYKSNKLQTIYGNKEEKILGNDYKKVSGKGKHKYSSLDIDGGSKITMKAGIIYLN